MINRNKQPMQIPVAIFWMLVAILEKHTVYKIIDYPVSSWRYFIFFFIIFFFSTNQQLSLFVSSLLGAFYSTEMAQKTQGSIIFLGSVYGTSPPLIKRKERKENCSHIACFVLCCIFFICKGNCTKSI